LSRLAFTPTNANGETPDPTRCKPGWRYWVAAAVVGLWLAALGLISLVGVVWAWGITDRVADQDLLVRWIGPDFTATALTGGLVLAAAGGVSGSVIHATSVFAARVGGRTFEASYAWWYLLRPVEAALLAVVLVAAVRAGAVALAADGSKTTADVVTFLAGSIAGLFTDTVMQRLRGLLGATRTDQFASAQPSPETVAPGLVRSAM